MTEKSNLPSFLLEEGVWPNETTPIWPLTTFVLMRNLTRPLFPTHMSEPETLQTLGLLQKTLIASPPLKEAHFLSADHLSALEKEFLFEHFFCLESFQNTLSGQGFIVDRSSSFLASLNVQDHLHLQYVDRSGQWEKSWNSLGELEMALASSLDFAFSPKFGYLTSNPAHCGTGLIASITLHLPALIHTEQFQEAIVKQKEEGVLFMGLEGASDKLIGDMVILRNQYTLGVTEEKILHSLSMTAMKLMVAEKALRSHIQQQSSPQIKDLVSRAYGLLMHSYELQTKEALDALSMIKLGIDLGWIKGISDSKINEIFFRCPRAHLLHALKEPSIQKELISHKRAEYVRAALKSATLEELP